MRAFRHKKAVLWTVLFDASAAKTPPQPVFWGVRTGFCPTPLQNLQLKNQTVLYENPSKSAILLTILGRQSRKEEIAVIHLAVCDDDPAARLLLSNYIDRFFQERGEPFRLALFESSEDFLAHYPSDLDILF